MIKISQHKFLKVFLLGFIIPVFLLLLGVNLAVFSALKQDQDLTVITQHQTKNEIFFGRLGEILANQKIQVEFKAIQDNLGAVSLRFNTFDRQNNDTLVFRIKTKWQKDWYSIKEYPTNQFKSYQFFLFEFPKIPDSKDKIYQFEIESLEGQPSNAVSISEYLPVFEAKYYFDRQEIFASKGSLISFIFKKINSLILDRDFAFAYLFFFFPFIFYCLWLILAKKNLKQNYLLFFLVGTGVLLDIFFVKRHSYLSSLLLVILIILAFKFYQIKPQKIAKWLFTPLFGLLLITILLGWEAIAGKAGIWLYFFLVIYAFFEFWPKFFKCILPPKS